MEDILKNKIEYIKGVGPAKAEIIQKELNYYTWEDILHHFPIRYIDKTKFFSINELKPEMHSALIKGIVTNVKESGTGNTKRFTAIFKDETGTMELVWFKGVDWIKKLIIPGSSYVIFGKPNWFNQKFTMPHPEITNLLEFINQKNNQLIPVYPTTEKMKKRGLDSKAFGVIVKSLLNELGNDKITENLPLSLIQKYGLLSKNNAIHQIHFPDNQEVINKAKGRLKLEELIFVQLKILQGKILNQLHIKGFNFNLVGNYFNDFYKNILPFELTNAQKKVLKEIRKDTSTGKQMNRLVQGDVGSGKTIVALMCMLLAIDNNFQACLMAPTEILATQHFKEIYHLLSKLNLKVHLLTGSTKKREREIIHADLENGDCAVLIGTHALIEDKVKFKNLGLAVIDEQHRFGVAQRSKLWQKNTLPPHVLVMTATPIPRTLAMTVYGDLDVSIIDELPPGRKAIVTKHFSDAQRLVVFGFIKEQIELGRQAYIVYPLIEESETMDYKDLMDGYDSIVRYFPLPKYQVAIVHGRMKPEDKEYEMKRFASGNAQIMVATTVIEVGVNVPNASVMVIESAERFGLSQLHQLRGRVGRGAEQSYCILMTGNKLGTEAKIRMRTMVETNDGFKISEVDLKLRGPGDLQGTQQSGVMDLKLASLTEDSKLLHFARERVKEILEEDPFLENPNNYPLKLHLLKEKNKGKINWGRIS